MSAKLLSSFFISIFFVTNVLAEGSTKHISEQKMQVQSNKQQVNTAKHINISTFDSGFGGFFTAKAIEQSAKEFVKTRDASFEIHHFGDTANAPYGEKTPEQIASLTSKGVLRALKNGANMVFIACNTASTQYPAVKKAVDAEFPDRSKDVISIIDASAEDVKERLDKELQSQNEVHFAILATPATIKSGVYPNTIAKLYNRPLEQTPLKSVTQARWLKEKGTTIESFTGQANITLENGKKIHLYQLAPANWVDLIEHAGSIKDKNTSIQRDLDLLEKLLPQNKKLDGVGEFCTHYPVFDNAIQAYLSEKNKADDNAFYIKQGPLMAEIFEKRMEETLPLNSNIVQDKEKIKTLYNMLRADITISGDNIDTTQKLAKTVFPNDAEPQVKQLKEENIEEMQPFKKARLQ